MQTAEQEYLAERKLARGVQESLVDQPENTKAVEVSQDAPIDNVVEPEAQANEEVAGEVEESALTENTQDESSDEESDLFYYDIDGEEVSSDQIKQWKSGSMMQADYTRGKQGVADDRRTLDSDKEDFNAQQSEFNTKLAQLNAMIEEDTPSAEALAEWREYEPEKLLDYQEKQAKRKDLLESSKGFAPTSNVDAQAEQAKLFTANPSWMDNGQQTKQFTDDMAMTSAYALKNGYSNEELSGLTSAHHLQTLINAAKYEKSKLSNAAIEKKVRKAPVSTRPKAQAINSVRSELEIVQKRFNKTGKDKDFLLLRKLQRQLK